MLLFFIPYFWNFVLVKECRDECASGMQLGIEGECEACPKGMYRSQGVEPACVPCPQGRTTPKLAASTVEECTLPVCPPGTFLWIFDLRDCMQ